MTAQTETRPEHAEPETETARGYNVTMTATVYVPEGVTEGQVRDALTVEIFGSKNPLRKSVWTDCVYVEEMTPEDKPTPKTKRPRKPQGLRGRSTSGLGDLVLTDLHSCPAPP